MVLRRAQQPVLLGRPGTLFVFLHRSETTDRPLVPRTHLGDPQPVVLLEEARACSSRDRAQGERQVAA